MIGVVAHQRRKIERGGESRLAVLEQELEALVGVARAPKAGELAHRPELAAISRGMDATRVRVDAGNAQLFR